MNISPEMLIAGELGVGLLALAAIVAYANKAIQFAIEKGESRLESFLATRIGDLMGTVVMALLDRKLDLGEGQEIKEKIMGLIDGEDDAA